MNYFMYNYGWILIMFVNICILILFFSGILNTFIKKYRLIVISCILLLNGSFIVFKLTENSKMNSYKNIIVTNDHHEKLTPVFTDEDMTYVYAEDIDNHIKVRINKNNKKVYYGRL